jgi:exosortase family protein XrtG
MNAVLLIPLILAYAAGLFLLRRNRHGLVTFVWGAVGFSVIVILVGLEFGWNVGIGSLEAALTTGIFQTIGMDVSTLGPATVVVADSTGWSILRIGVECSTLVEGAVFSGLMLFYPRFSNSDRILRLTAGVGGTFVINMLRIGLIVTVISIFGKPAAALAHTVIGRLVFFVGIVVIYWRLFTLPTLHIIRGDLNRGATP